MFRSPMSLFKLLPTLSSWQCFLASWFWKQHLEFFHLSSHVSNTCKSTTYSVAQAGGARSPDGTSTHGTTPITLMNQIINARRSSNLLTAILDHSSENTDWHGSFNMFYCTVRCQMLIFLNSPSRALFFQLYYVGQPLPYKQISDFLRWTTVVYYVATVTCLWLSPLFNN